ncbi:MAG: hypothetical protein IKJ82_08830 [Oscillospiraceae bacterium]|nr:hypothetical protein [Oscillospiraceae bacterium]
MAGIGISGTGKKEPEYPTTSTGAQGSMTGTNLFGSVVPKKVEANAGANAGTGASGGNGGSNGGSGGTGGTKSDTEVILVEGSGPSGWSTPPGGFSGAGTTGQKEPTNEEKAEASIAELKNKYAGLIRDQYNSSAERLRTERDEALRENWILQQREQAALPEQLAAAGINGGAAETSIADLKARYQGNRNEIRKGYLEELGDLGESALQQQAENEKSYNDRWAEYLLSLAEAEKRNELERKYG